MAGITLAQAQAQLDAAMAAAEGVALNKAVEYQGRKVTIQDLDQINRSIDFWDAKVKALSTAAENGSRTGRVRTMVAGW